MEGKRDGRQARWKASAMEGKRDGRQVRCKLRGRTIQK